MPLPGLAPKGAEFRVILRDEPSRVLGLGLLYAFHLGLVWTGFGIPEKTQALSIAIWLYGEASAVP
jgi:hypothetical protein